MSLSLKLFFIAIVTVVVIDYIWLGFIMKGFYMDQFAELARKVDGEFKPVMWAAGIVYLLLGIGLVGFVLPRIDPQDSWLIVFGWGALFGLIVYGVYDMTNHATLYRWPMALMAVDMTWGAVVCGLTTVITKAARDWLT